MIFLSIFDARPSCPVRQLRDARAYIEPLGGPKPGTQMPKDAGLYIRPLQELEVLLFPRGVSVWVPV